MEDLCICKICKKVFTDKHGLQDHQMTTHPVQHQQLNNNEQLIPQQFRNHSNISITRIPGGGGIGKEHSGNSVVVIQSSPMNQNQNMFGRKTAGPPSSMKMKKQEGGRVKPSYRSPPASGGNSSVRQMVTTTMGIEDGTQNWKKWQPASARGVVVEPIRTGRTTDGHIITQSAAERAIIAIPQSSAAATAAAARKNVPKLLPMVPQGNKRGGGGVGGRQRVAVTNPGTSGTGVPNIMENLGRMKELSTKHNRSALTPKMISAGQGNKKGIPSPQIPVVNKPPAPRKQKIIPRNAFSNALPVASPPLAAAAPLKPKANTQPNKQATAAAAKRIPPVHPPPSALELEEEDDDMVIDDQQPEEAEDEEEFDEEPEPVIQPAKKSVPTATVAPSKAAGVAGGKAPPQKKNMNNRFNPIETSPKKGKGAQTLGGSPNGKAAKVTPVGGGGGVVPSTSAAANGTNKKTAAGVASAAGGGGGGAVVAKKSNAAAKPPPPPKQAKGKKKGKEDTLTTLKKYVPTMPGTDYEMPKLSAIGSYTNRLGNQVWVCLVCNEKESDDSSKDMICCDMCEDWYHWECVGIREAMAESDPWYCKRCIYQACAPNKAKKDFPRIFKNDVFD